MRNNEMITFRLDSSTRNILTELSVLRHMSVSSLCRYIIKNYLLREQQVRSSDSATSDYEDKEYFENAPY